MANRRTPLAAPRGAGTYAQQPIGAENVNDFIPSNVLKGEPDEKGFSTWRWLRTSGKHEAQPWTALLLGLLMEVLASMIIGTCVGLARWSATGPDPLMNGFLVALAYAGSFFATIHMTFNHVFRRHCNGAITLAYFVANEIGLIGVIFYLFAQLLGSLTAGAIIRSMTLDLSVVNPLITQPIPIPTTAITSYTNVWTLEWTIPIMITALLLIWEFLNTPGAVGVDGRSDQKVLAKNYYRSMFFVSIILFVFVLFLFPFQSFTFSNVAYLGGLFSGIAPAGPGNSTRDIVNTSQLKAVLFTNSVFSNGGNAWVYYTFLPLAGGVFGAAIFWVVFYIGVANRSGLAFGSANANKAMFSRVQTSSGGASSSPNAAVQSQMSQLRSPLMGGAN